MLSLNNLIIILEACKKEGADPIPVIKLLAQFKKIKTFDHLSINKSIDNFTKINYDELFKLISRNKR